MTCFAPSASRTASSSCSSSSRPSATCGEAVCCDLEKEVHPAASRVHWQEHRGKASTCLLSQACFLGTTLPMPCKAAAPHLHSRLVGDQAGAGAEEVQQVLGRAVAPDL